MEFIDGNNIQLNTTNLQLKCAYLRDDAIISVKMQDRELVKIDHL